MSNENVGLTEIPRTNRRYQRHQRWNFTKGNVREAFERVFSPDTDYVLFQTIANQKAVDILNEYVAHRKTMASPWIVRKIQETDKPAYVPGANSRCNGLQFDNNLMDSYMHAINKIASENLGKKYFANYPFVATDGVHTNERDPNAIYWPRIFIVNTEKEGELKGIIEDLVSDESLGVLQELESPQFYQMAEIETLHLLGIAPLTRLPQELRVSAQDLSMYIDFLAQMTETYRWTGPVSFED